MAYAKAEVRATIGWGAALEAVCGIVDDTPHLGKEFTLDDAERLERVAASIRKALGHPEKGQAIKGALADFVNCIDATGGAKTDRKGHVVPVADESWIDLGDAYRQACVVLGREMQMNDD